MAVTFIKVTEEEQIEKIAEIAAPIWHETYDCSTALRPRIT